MTSSRKPGATVKTHRLDELTDRQKQFMAELLADPACNATQAAKKVGYKNPSIISQKLLRNPVIAKALGTAMAERQKKLGLSSERVLEEVTHIALRDAIDLVDPKTGRIIIDDLRKLPETIRRCIDGIKCKEHVDVDGNVTQEIELKLVGKLGALELLMKHLGMITLQKNVSGNVDVNHNFNWDMLYGDDTQSEDPVEQQIIDVDSKPALTSE